MIEVYNFLDGKNLCNIFANLIVEKINETFPDAETEITVVNVRNFFVVKGKTTSDKIIKCAEILSEFLKIYDEKKSESVRVIDVIEYSTKPNQNNNFICEYSSDKKNFNELKLTINDYAKKNIYLNLKIDEVNKNVFYDSNVTDKEVSQILIKYFSEFNLLRKDFNNETYVSDKFYGLSNNNEKLYHFLLRYITFCVFSLGISKKIELQLYSTIEINKTDNLNITFNIKNDGHIVKTKWLESLILDVFPFEYESLIKEFDMKKYNPIKEIIDETYVNPWQKLDRISDMVLI